MTDTTLTRRARGAACCLLLVCTSGWAEAPSINWGLDEAIRQLQQQADGFETAMARVETTWTGSDGESNTTSGTGFFHRDGDMRYHVDGGETIMFVDRNSVQQYKPNEKIVEEYSFRKHPDRLEPYIRLGFSITGRDLSRDYLVTILGEEDVGDSRTLMLELTPEDDRHRAVVRSVKLWIDQASWMPVKQQINATNSGTFVLKYTGMARNLELKPELFRDNWPRGTEKVSK